jgi:hypothetical protein
VIRLRIFQSYSLTRDLARVPTRHAIAFRP